MFVQRVVVPASRRRSWTVIGEDGVAIDPVERYLAHLTDVERSPNTVKAYARFEGLVRVPRVAFVRLAGGPT